MNYARQKTRDKKLALAYAGAISLFFMPPSSSQQQQLGCQAPSQNAALEMTVTPMVKTGNRDLAMKSWQRALDLAPHDVALQRSITHLNECVNQEQNARAANTTRDAKSTIQTIQPTPDQALDAVAH